MASTPMKIMNARAPSLHRRDGRSAQGDPCGARALRRAVYAACAICVASLGSCHRNRAGVVATAAAPEDTVWMAPKRAPLSAELRELVKAVEQLPDASGQRSHAQLASALHALGGAVRALGPAAVPHGAKIEELARLLQASSTSESTHVEHVVAALNEALAAIHDSQAHPVGSTPHDTYVASVQASSSLVTTQPLLQQQARIHLALVTIANALAASRGAAAPFAGASVAREHRPDLDAFVRHSRRAAELASAVAASTDWKSARMRTAETLQTLANAVASAPRGTGLGAHAMMIGFEAGQLERAETVDQRRVNWTKAGLLQTVYALERMRPADSPVLDSLVASAKSAVNAIDVDATFAFQRPAIQDALRAVVSAFASIATYEQQTRRQAVR